MSDDEECSATKKKKSTHLHFARHLFPRRKKSCCSLININKYSICFLYIRIKIYIANYDDSFSQIKHRFETITRKPIITPIISSRSYQQNEKKKEKEKNHFPTTTKKGKK